MSLLTMKLELTVMAARNIKMGDITGTSDAYMKIFTNEMKFKTKTTKPTLNPTWMETFTFTANPDQEIKFEIYDKDKYTKDDKLGKVIYNIPAMVNDDTIYEIQKFDTKGLLYFSIKCVSGGLMKEYRNPNPHDRMILKISHVHMRYYTFHAHGDYDQGGNYKFKMGVSSKHTPEARTDYINSMFDAKPEQFFLVEVQPEEKLHFRLHFKEAVGLLKRVSAEGDWRVPDMRDREVLDVAVPSKYYATFNVRIECLRGIYHDAFPNQIPCYNDLGRTDVVRYQVEALRGENFIQVDTFTPSDPCVNIKTKYNKKWRKSVCFFNTSCPEWRQAFKMKCHPGEKVDVDCADHEYIGNFKALGTGSFNMPSNLKEEQSTEVKVQISTSEHCRVYFRVKRMRDLSGTYLKLKKGNIVVGDPLAKPNWIPNKVDDKDGIHTNIK